MLRPSLCTRTFVDVLLRELEKHVNLPMRWLVPLATCLIACLAVQLGRLLAGWLAGWLPVLLAKWLQTQMCACVIMRARAIMRLLA